MKRTIKNIISVIWTFFRLLFIKFICGSNFSYYYIERISPNVDIDINRGASVTFGKKIRIHSGCKIKVRKGAQLEIKEGAKMNNNCIVACRDKIVIGEGTEFGPAVYLYDHDHIHSYETGKNDGYNTKPIIIGKNCWIGANTVILKGTVLGDNCVVGAGSVISGEYPAGSLIYQKRETTVKIIEKG